MKKLQRISLSVPVTHTVVIEPDQSKAVIKSSLLQMIGCEDADSIKIDESGELIAEYDYGHHRGGIETVKVRKATDLDRAVIVILGKLNEC